MKLCEALIRIQEGDQVYLPGQPVKLDEKRAEKLKAKKYVKILGDAPEENEEDDKQGKSEGEGKGEPADDGKKADGKQGKAANKPTK